MTKSNNSSAKVNINPNVTRLINSLKEHGYNEMAKRLDDMSILNTASPKIKFTWAKDICGSLDEEFDEKTKIAIRMDCACGPSMGHMNKLKKLYSETGDLKKFAKSLTDSNIGASAWIEGENLFFSYPTCYCSCVKGVNEQLSKTWCYCTLGYTKRMFDYVLEKSINVELIESIKTGGDRCIIKVIIS